MWWLAVLAPTLASDGPDWLDPHASVAVGGAAGVFGLAAPVLGPTIDARAGWVGLPEVRAQVAPALIWVEGPHVLVQVETEVCWGLKTSPRVHLGPAVGVWTVPGSAAGALHAGVSWVKHGDRTFDAFAGLQAIVWSDAGALPLPRVRMRWTREDLWYLGFDLSGPDTVFTVGRQWGRP